MKISNMLSASGNPIPNQFKIEHEGKIFFQSYNSTIVMIDRGTVTLDSNKWDFSKTTGKWRNKFLGESKKETQAKIDSGEYKLADLNK